MNRKRLLLVCFLIFAMSLSFFAVACDGGEPSDATTDATTDVTTDMTTDIITEATTEVTTDISTAATTEAITDTLPSETTDALETAESTESTAHEHSWLDATCDTPKTCSACGDTEGEPNGHSGGQARCMKKAVCDACGKEYGARGAHVYTHEIMTDEYLRTPATMMTKATYYYACVYCEKKSLSKYYETGKTLLEAIAEDYKAKDGDVEKFIFFSDPHYITDEVNGTWKSGSLAKIEKASEYYSIFSPIFAVSGGDWLNDSNSRDNAISILKDVKKRLTDAFGKVYFATGNHDYNFQTRFNDDGTPLGYTGLSKHELTQQERIDAWYSEFGSTYHTFEGENTKFYLFDTGKDWDHLTVNEYDKEQIVWFLDGLSANDDKHIAMIAHIVYLNETIIHPAVLKYTEISAAYNARANYTYDGKIYDFSEKTGRVEFILGGHEHYDKTGFINGIAYSMINAAKHLNTDTFLFDILLVDYEQRVINTIRLVDESERTIHLDSCEAEHYSKYENGHLAIESCDICHVVAEASIEPHNYVYKMTEENGVKCRVSTCITCGYTRSDEMGEGDGANCISDHKNVSVEITENQDGSKLYSYVCDQCAHTVKTQTVSADVNYFAEAGRAYSRYKVMLPQQLINDGDGNIYARFTFYSTSGSVCVTNGSNFSSKLYLTRYDSIKGSGKYAVFKIRAESVYRLRFGAQTWSDDKIRDFPDYEFKARESQDAVSGEWKVFVVDLEKAFSESQYVSNDVTVTEAVFGFMMLNAETDKAYFDLQYFAICDDWSEVESVVGDENVLFTGWRDTIDDMMCKSNGDPAEPETTDSENNTENS